MPEERLARRDRGRRAEGREPVDHASRMLGRAAAVAAGIAVASIGLAYVTSQAGVANVTPLADGGESAGTGRNLTSTVPAVLSPELAVNDVDLTVIVEPDPVAPPSAPVRTGRAVTAPTLEGDEPTPGREVVDDESAPVPPADERAEDGRDGEDGWSDLREWWEAQSSEWDQAWRDALSSEWSSDARRSTSDDRDSTRQGRDRGRSGGRDR